MKRNDILNRILSKTARAILSLALLIGINHYAGAYALGAYTYTGTSSLTLDGYSTLSGTLTIANGGSYTLNLNGQTLENLYNNRVFLVLSGGKLVINGPGTIKNGRSNRGGFAFVLGNVELNNVTIDNCYGIYTNEGENSTTAISFGCGGALYIGKGGVVNMNSGTTISNCHTYKIINSLGNLTGYYTAEGYYTWGKGGAVFIEPGGTFNMTGGTITSSWATNGGAVYLNNGGAVFNMTGGTISDCKCYSSGLTRPKINGLDDIGGGAVMVRQNSTFIMSGSATIKNCYGGNWSYGHGVYNVGNVTMKDNATISGCVPEVFKGKTPSINTQIECITYKTDGKISFTNLHYGGGVYQNGPAVFNMEGGIIKDNVSFSGGGVLQFGGADGKPIFNLNGGTITNNYAIGERFSNGGGLFIEASTFNFLKGTVSYNKAGRYGGGFNVNESATIKLGGSGQCLIIGNEASHGGGISQEAGDCVMSINSTNVIIKENLASGVWAHKIDTSPNDDDWRNDVFGEQNVGYGGGLFIEKGTLTANAGYIQDNDATGGGGGISFRMVRVPGDITANIGGTINISGNDALAYSGGGIDIYTKNSKNTSANKVTVNVNGGTIAHNTAKTNGGACYISINDNSTATLNLGHSGSFIAEQNVAGQYGGAFGCYMGSVSIYAGNIRDNVSEWSGGAIFIEKGNLTINRKNDIRILNNTSNHKGGGIHLVNGSATIDRCVLMGNTAKLRGGAISIENGNLSVTDQIELLNNYVTGDYKTPDEHGFGGGAISMNGGSVTMAQGLIHSNHTKMGYGGGLYVIASSSNSVTLNGGDFYDNSAHDGGGVCVNGPVNMTLSADVTNNQALNGGGICLMNGAKMKFGNGLITGNTAYIENTDVMKEKKTAYQETHSTLEGVGGGIFLDTGTSLEFINPTAMGIYTNSAEFAADDIFTNGNGTYISIPDISMIQLKGFDVPTSRLYWQEDYVNNDTEYSKGTYALSNGQPPAHRYLYALRNSKATYHLSDGNHPSVDDYVCLTVGFDMVFVPLRKYGLQKGEVATFKVLYDDDGTESVFRTVPIMGTSDAADSYTERYIALPTGQWKIVETDWTWRYDGTPSFSPQPGANGYYDVAKNEQTNKVEITGSSKSDRIEVRNIHDNQDIRSHENAKINYISPTHTVETPPAVTE